MPISQIGTNQTGTASNGGDVTLTFSTAPIRGDVVYVWGGHGTNTNTIGPSTAGYTALLSSTGSALKFGVWRKVMGATPDTTVVCQGGGNTADGVAYGSMVLRGVDNTTPEDATLTSATSTSTNPDSPSINVATAGAWVLSLAGSGVSDNAVTAPTNYINAVNANNADTSPITIGGANRANLSVGAEDPASWTAWTSGLWIAATVAVRPAMDLPDNANARAEYDIPTQPIFPISFRTWLQASTGLVTPPPRPTNQFDWPLPKAWEYPVDFRTWTARPHPSINPVYMPSRVVEWGTWEDQRKALTYIAINPALLAPAVVNKPVQTIWTLPIAPQYPVDLRTFTQAPRAPDRKPPLQIIWNLPTSPVYPTDLRTWLVKPQAPNPPPQPPNDDLSLPAAPVYPVSLRTWTRAPQITVAVSLQPANQYTWSLPVAPVYPVNLRTWTVAPQAVTLNYIPSRVVEWGAPARVDFAQPWQQPLNVALLTAQVAARPANQFDWPLPVARPRGEFTLTRAPHPSGQQRPIVVSDWPLPIQPHRVIQTWLTGPRTATGLKPVLVIDWPLPIRRAEPIRTWTQTPQPAQVVTGKPVNQSDWPLPLRAAEPVRTWIQSPNNAPTVTYMPSRVTDWGTQFDSNYPVSLRTWSNGGVQVEYVFRAPYYSLRWSQPYFNYDLAPFAVALRSPVPQKPVNQSDWPLPLRRTRDAVGYTFAPRAPDRMPVNQYNWPLPILRTPAAITYTRSPQFGAPEQMPVNQDDWPLPIRRTREAVTWTQSPNFAQQVQPKPVNNFDGSIPTRPQVFMQAVQQSNIVIQAASAAARPVNNIDLSFPRRVSQIPTWFDQQTTALHNRPMPVNQDDWPLPFAAPRIHGGYSYTFAPFIARPPERMPPKTAVFGPPIGYEYPNELRSFLRSPPSIVPAVIPPTPRRPTTKGPLWIAQPGRHNDPDSGRSNISGDSRAGSTMPRRYKDRS